MVTKKTKEASNTPLLSDKAKAELVSKLALKPSANAAAVIEAFSKGSFGEADINILIDELQTQFTQVENDDLQYCEAMLVGQANALQAIFVSLARRATNQQYLPQYETYMRLALKAQNQCRSTIEALATIKNPPVIYAKQANISNGHQQINNGTSSSPHAQAGKIINQQSELLEVDHGSETMDSRATSAAGRKDKAMATVD